jgi:hypothetical protein
VLEQFCQIVEDRFPGRDVVIRRMDLRCSLAQEQLADLAEASRCAAELAATIVVPESDDEIPADDVGTEGEAEDTGRHGTRRPTTGRPGMIEAQDAARRPLLDGDEAVAGMAGSETGAKSGRIVIEEDRDDAEPVDPLHADEFADAVEWIMSGLRAEARGASNEWVDAWPAIRPRGLVDPSLCVGRRSSRHCHGSTRQA